MSLTRAHEAQAIADRLIDLYHSHLARIDVRCWWMDPPAVDHTGMTVAGQVRLLRPGVRIELARTAWQHARRPWRWALLDHELAHVRMAASGRLYIIRHDYAGRDFRAVVRRWGRWDPELVDLPVEEQLPLTHRPNRADGTP